MAVPASADAIVRALRNEGVRVVEHRSWRTNSRNHMGAWGPVHGIMLHHTVTSGDTPQQTLNSVNLCYDGHSALPGPLCHGVIAKDGTVYMVGHGRANHAGSGDDDVLQAVINESAPLPPDNETNTDGNRHFYGFECINRGDGFDPWPPAQVAAMVRASTALAKLHGWTERSVIGHLEWQPGKVDPRGVAMSSLREGVRSRLAFAPTTEESSMALTDDDIRRIWAVRFPANGDRDMRQLIDDIPEETAKLLLRTDGQYLAPQDAGDWVPDINDSRHWWSGTTVFDSITTATRENRKMLLQIMEHLGITPTE